MGEAEAPAPLLHPNLAEIYRRKVAELHVTLNHDDSRAEAADIIRSLIDEIVLTPENGELRIDLKGELAPILAFANDDKKPTAHRRDGIENKGGCGGSIPPLPNFPRLGQPIPL